jgi:predicted nucleic acid-binding protein
VRVVVDANILASGVFWAGTPGRVLQLWLNGRIDLLASSDIVMEYEQVLLELAVAGTWHIAGPAFWPRT